MDAQDNIPGFLDPLLDYLSSALPPGIYDTVVSILSYSISFCTSLFHLLKALASSNPASWDAQTILPPLITVLGAYLALVSFYRTTGWMIRTTFAFIKWGTLLSLLAAGAGYMMANANAGGENGVGGQFRGPGLVAALGSMILDMLNGHDRNAAGSARTRRTPSSRSRAQKQSAPRPKPWEPWDRHQEWQYEENAQNEGDGGSGAQEIMGQIFGSVGRVMREGGWWEAAKRTVDQALQEKDDDVDEGAAAGTEKRRRQPPRQAKTKAKSKSSSR